MKKLFLFLVFGFIVQVGLAQSQAGIRVLDRIVPNGVLDKYPTHVDTLGYAGYAVCKDTAELNHIPSERRKPLMTRILQSDSCVYLLLTPPNVLPGMWKNTGKFGSGATGSFINNQSAVNQLANFNIAGTGIAKKIETTYNLISDSVFTLKTFGISGGHTFRAYWYLKNDSVNYNGKFPFATKLSLFFSGDGTTSTTTKTIQFKSGGGAIATAGPLNDSPGWLAEDFTYLSYPNTKYYFGGRNGTGEIGVANGVSWIANGTPQIKWDSTGVKIISASGTFTTYGHAGYNGGRTLGTYDYVYKRYVDTSFAAIGSGVLSFNTRTGAVIPVAGDYASLTETLTNKSGNISQWTNDSGYLISSYSGFDSRYLQLSSGDLNRNFSIGNNTVTAGTLKLLGTTLGNYATITAPGIISGSQTFDLPFGPSFHIMAQSTSGTTAQYTDVNGKIDTTYFQTVTNFFPKGDTRYYTKTLSDARYSPILTFNTGLTNTSNTITNNLSTGVSGGQSAIGGTSSSDILTFKSYSGSASTANTTYSQYGWNYGGSTDAASNGVFNASRTLTNPTTANRGIFIQQNIAATSGSNSQQNIGGQFTIFVDATNTQNLTGNQYANNSTSNVSTGATGTISRLGSYFAQTSNNATGATVTNEFSYAAAPIGTTGTVSNYVYYAILSGINTFPTGNWGFYNGGGVNNYLGTAWTGINTTTQVGSDKLDVNGRVSFSDNTQGLILGAYTAGGGNGAIYPYGVTPGSSNYAFSASTSLTEINGTTANVRATTTANILIGGVNYVTITSAGTNFNGSLVTGLASPSGSTDATNKAYVDAHSLPSGSDGQIVSYYDGGVPLAIGRLSVQNAKTVFAPSTGGTVNVNNNYENIIKPSGALATLTINLPSSPADGDTVNLTFTQAVTAITYTGGTVVGAPTSAAATGQYHLTFDVGSTTWY